MGRIWSKRKRKVDNASEKKSYEDTKEIISGKFHRSYRFAVDFLIKGKMSWDYSVYVLKKVERG